MVAAKPIVVLRSGQEYVGGWTETEKQGQQRVAESVTVAAHSVCLHVMTPSHGHEMRRKGGRR